MTELAWTLEEGRRLAAEIEDAVSKVGFHVALGGSVLHAGRSEKDLDLLAFPHTSDCVDWRILRAALESIGMRQQFSDHSVRARWRRLGSLDDKHVEVWNAPESYGRKRVDVFMVR